MSPALVVVKALVDPGPPRRGMEVHELAALGAAIKEPGRRLGQILDESSLDCGLSAVPISVQEPKEAAVRALYERRRLVTVGRAHLPVCVRWGPAGRVGGKAILSDLWLAAAADGIADKADGETDVAGELVGVAA